MIRHQRPRKKLDVALFYETRQAIEKCFSIFRVPKDIPALDAAGHDVLQNVGNVQSWASWHGRSLPCLAFQANNNLKNLTTSPINRKWDLKIQDLLVKMFEGHPTGDLHIHSTYSDGLNSVETIVGTAKEFGYCRCGSGLHDYLIRDARGIWAEEWGTHLSGGVIIVEL